MADAIDQHLGHKIAHARRASRWQVNELAEEIGVTAAELERMETGRTRISALHLARCANVLKRPLSWFYDGLPGQSKFEKSKLG